MSLSSRLNRTRPLWIALVVIMVFALQPFARAENLQEEPRDGKIDIVYPAEWSAPYRERRGNWSVLFGLNVDRILPENFRSQVSNEDYSTLFGDEPIPLVELQLGFKFNFGLGGITLSGILGKGEISDHMVGTYRDLGLVKKGATASLILDTLFKEPFVAPYIEGQAYEFDWSEAEDAPLNLPSQSGTTGIATAFKVGLLFQLNWLDPEASFRSQDSMGLTNAYFDLFLSQYNTSNADDDPNFETSTNFGAGLRLEF